jgi:S1-C subfamily serine protease
MPTTAAGAGDVNAPIGTGVGLFIARLADPRPRPVSKGATARPAPMARQLRWNAEMENTLRRSLWAINVLIVAVSAAMVVHVLRVAVEEAVDIVQTVRHERAAAAPDRHQDGPRAPEGVEVAIERVGESAYRVDRASLQAVLGNMPLVARSARIVPEVRDGQPRGLRMYAVSAGGFLARLGLQNGDVVRTVNGTPLTSPERTLEAYALLARASKITLGVDRGSQSVSLEYLLQ